MSKLETPKSWQQAENKRSRGIFKSSSHFSDGHLLSKLLSLDSWDNPHKDSWPISETKTNKRCRTAISHPWSEADCGPALLFPPLHFPLSADCPSWLLLFRTAFMNTGRSTLVPNTLLHWEQFSVLKSLQFFSGETGSL